MSNLSYRVSARSQIVYQQLSVKVAAVIFQRLVDLCGGESSLTPAKALELPDDDLRHKCGFSYRKAGYLKHLASSFVSGELSDVGLSKMTDEEAMATNKAPGSTATSGHGSSVHSSETPSPGAAASGHGSSAHNAAASGHSSSAHSAAASGQGSSAQSSESDGAASSGYGSSAHGAAATEWRWGHKKGRMV